MRVTKSQDTDRFMLEALPLRGLVLYCAVDAVAVLAIAYGWGPFSDVGVLTRVAGVVIIGGIAALYAFGRFGTIIDRQAKTLCNWYEWCGLGIRWTFPINPAHIRIECRLGGHRDVSDLQYTRHLFLINRFGPPLCIGRVKGVSEAREIAEALGAFLELQVEEGSCRAGDQVCVPPPWANLGDGFFRGARLSFGRSAVA